MNVKFVEAPDQDLLDFFEKRIEDFNLIHWEVKKKVPFALKVTNDAGEIVAGAAGKSFGLWFFVDNLWVSEGLRRQKWGTKILSQLEAAAKKRGCKYIFLETLNFQARPFYEKFGYQVQWVQNNYPREGCKYFMTKTLGA